MQNRTLIYDADCGFCTRSAVWLRNAKVNVKPWQGIPDLNLLGLNEDKVSTAAYWFDEGKVIDRAEGAIARALIARGVGWKPVGYFILLLRPVAAPVYRYIARNRHAMPGGTNACKIPSK